MAGTIYVHTDHNPDDVRTFYEIPDAIARLVMPAGNPRTFAQCLADAVTERDEWEERYDELLSRCGGTMP